MKVLIAYDGSDYAQAALDDVLRAGLPDDSEILIASVADEKSQAVEIATDAANRLAQQRPSWDLRGEGHAGTPAKTLIEVADAWHPHLLVAGSHGRTAFGRFLLGSVSHKLVTESRCSVRIARRTGRPLSDPPKIVVGADRSEGAAVAVSSVAARSWLPGTEVAVVAAVELSEDRFEDCEFHESPAMQLAEWRARKRARAEAVAVDAAKALCDAGLKAHPIVEAGSPKRLLVEVAARIGADYIFLGSSGEGRSEELGSAAIAVALRSPCSIEIARRASETATRAGETATRSLSEYENSIPLPDSVDTCSAVPRRRRSRAIQDEVRKLPRRHGRGKVSHEGKQPADRRGQKANRRPVDGGDRQRRPQVQE